MTATDLLGFASYLLLPLFGLAIWRLEGVRRLDLAARLAIAAAIGAMTVPITLTLMTMCRIPWTRSTIIPIFSIIVAAGFRAIRGRTPLPHTRITRAALIGIGVIAVIVFYGLLTARMTSGDLHFFWGPKAILYFQNGGVTLTVLKSAIHKYMNPDYPLLLPLVNVWSLVVSRQFAWWGALLGAGVFLFASVAVVRATSGEDAVAVLMAAALGYTAAKSNIPGGAEPFLLLFETIALCALTMIEDRRTQTILAALSLAGAAATKIEGATFAIAVILAIVLVKRDIKRAAIIGAPAGIVVAGWMMFVLHQRLSVVYHAAAMPIYYRFIPSTIVDVFMVASYDVYWLPWIAAIALIAIGSPRRAALPIVVCILTLGVSVFFYIHSPDPKPWVLASGPRVLMTPLCSLLIAAAAARPTARKAADARVLESTAHGVVP